MLMMTAVKVSVFAVIRLQSPFICWCFIALQAIDFARHVI